MFSIPTWALPLLLTLVVAVLGFAYRLATRAERLTDKLETLVERMGAYEARLATVDALKTADALRAQEITHLREGIAAMEREIAAQRERLHAFANELSTCRTEIARVSSIPTPLPHVPRPPR